MSEDVQGLVVGSSVLRASDGARYELRAGVRWFPMDYHCVECADDDVLFGDIGEFAILTIPVSVLESAKADLWDEGAEGACGLDITLGTYDGNPYRKATP